LPAAVHWLRGLLLRCNLGQLGLAPSFQLLSELSFDILDQ
jgi:hypothetical protein